jgi:hypothetical protein
MKLYTEEEILNYLTNHKSTITRYDLQNIPHIELPSDEELYINANIQSDNVEQHIGFIKGLKFMRELIQGGIDGD